MSAAGRRTDPQYAKRRAVLIERGQWQPYADAAPVREHVRTLLGGLSKAQIARPAGIPESSLDNLLYADYERIRPEAAAALLRVAARPGLAVTVGLVGTAGASRRLQALTVTGWSPRLLAGRLLMDTSSVRRVRDGDRSLIQLGTSQAVSALYREIWDQPPQGTTPERIAAAKARAYAVRRGWAPPAAWDDDQLDAPDGRPAEGWQWRASGRRSSVVLAEEAEELFRQDLTRDLAAERLGISRSGLDRALTRARRQAATQHPEAEAG